jgi:hypothetical protein
MPSVPKLFIGNKSDLRTASNPGISVETVNILKNFEGI